MSVYMELTANPLFGICLTLGVFTLAQKIFQRYPYPLFNPFVWTVLVIILILKVGHIPYQNYYQGGKLLNTLIIPATVALGIPLYNTFHLLKNHYRSISVGIIFGVLLNTLMSGLAGFLLHLNHPLIASLMPKSVTTAIAIEIAGKMGGNPSITLTIVIVTGIVGTITGPYMLKWFHIEEPVARGIALGSSAHAFGTAKALEYGRVEGAMSGLAIGVTGAVTVFIAPLVFRTLAFFF